MTWRTSPSICRMKNSRSWSDPGDRRHQQPTRVESMKERVQNAAGMWAAMAMVAVVGMGVVFPGEAAADPPPVDGVEVLGDQIEQLEDTYLVPAMLEGRYRLETRFNEAKVAYLLGEYDRAAILFVAIVDSPEGDEFAGYREALYLLGASLFEARNYRAARSYFNRLLERGPGAFYQPTLVKLLEIASEIDDYENVDELYDRLDDIEEVNPTVHYTRGKTLYREGRPRAARPWLQRAARDDDYAYTARYFEGVVLAAEGEIGAAEEIFEGLTRRSPETAVDREVVELAHLARGRIAYERDDYETAIDHYLQLPRESDHFTRALYELTWALVALENYRAALRNLDILLVSDPEPRFVPEAKALMADMAMRLGDYDEARRWFGEIIDTFTPVRRELQEFVAEHDELDQFFLELVRDELRGLQPDFLPEEVTQWVADDELVEASGRLLGDGVTTQEEIDEIYETIDEIEAAMEMGSAIEAFPRLAEGWAQGVELEARLIDIQDQLLDWELRQIRPLLSSADRQRLDEIEEQLAELQEVESRAPRTREELEHRDQEIRDRFRRLRAEIDHVAFEIDNLEETLDAIGEYVRRELDELTEEERRQIAGVREEIEVELDQLEADRDTLERELERTQRAYGARDDTLQRHRQLRDEIQHLQQERAELVERKVDDLDPGEIGEARRVAEVRRRLPGLKDRLDDYFYGIDELVDERMDEIRATLEHERSLLASHQSDLEAWSQNAEQTMGEIAMWNFLKVDEEFEHVVRSGHMGMVDVDWQQYDDAAREHRELVDEKLETEDMLREAFPDVD